MIRNITLKLNYCDLNKSIITCSHYKNKILHRIIITQTNFIYQSQLLLTCISHSNIPNQSPDFTACRMLSLPSDVLVVL